METGVTTVRRSVPASFSRQMSPAYP